MTSLEIVEQFVIPEEFAVRTDLQLREAGSHGVERFVLWSGRAEGSLFQVEAMHVPEQAAYKLSSGLMVRVEGDELHRLNVWLFENEQELAIQIHSHPTDAFHSDLDDAMPIVTARGALSIVVPDFGERGLRGSGVATYRLSDSGWLPVGTEIAKQLIVYKG